MVKYPDSYDPITEYWLTFTDNGGDELVSRKIYNTYKKLVLDLKNTDDEFYYSNQRGNHILEFIENFCKHSKGKMGGKSIELELWEKAMLTATFGFIDMEGNRKYQRAVLIIGKKNGKSLIASAVALYLQVADGENGAEIYAVAKLVATLNRAKSVKAKLII